MKKFKFFLIFTLSFAFMLGSISSAQANYEYHEHDESCFDNHNRLIWLVAENREVCETILFELQVQAMSEVLNQGYTIENPTIHYGQSSLVRSRCGYCGSSAEVSVRSWCTFPTGGGLCSFRYVRTEAKCKSPNCGVTTILGMQTVNGCGVWHS